jgi:hypothetical protein
VDISEAHQTWIFGCLLLVGLLLAYVALTTAIALLRDSWKLVPAFIDPRAYAGHADGKCPRSTHRGRYPGQRQRPGITG